MSTVPGPDQRILKQNLHEALTVSMRGVRQKLYLTLVCPLSGMYDLVIHTGRQQDPMVRLKLADGDARQALEVIERVYAYEPNSSLLAAVRRMVYTMNERRASVLIVVEQMKAGGFMITNAHEHVGSLWP